MKANEPGPAVLMLKLDVSSEAVRKPRERGCPHCREELELHQPDATNPDRLLGTCGSCGSWYIVEDIDGALSVLARLPDRAELGQALDRAGVRPATLSQPA